MSLNIDSVVPLLRQQATLLAFRNAAIGAG
jgi:hypothetical protein